MSRDIDITVTGTEELQQALTVLAKTEKNPAIRRALGQGGGYISKKSKERLRKRMNHPNGHTGNLLSSFVVKVKRKQNGVLVGFNKKGSHAHLVDMGHEMVVGPKRVKTGKRTKPLHFHTDTRKQDMPQAARITMAGLYDVIKPYQ